MRAKNGYALKKQGAKVISIYDLAECLRENHNTKKMPGSVLPYEELVNSSWVMISPFWPLENLVAVNPLFGLIHLKYKDALGLASSYFIHADLPPSMAEVNRHTIKWCQAYFDKGQATIGMPNRDLGLFKCWKQLARWDRSLGKQHDWLQSLSTDSNEVIIECLDKLRVPKESRLTFLALMLTTLPGWASYIKQQSGWNHNAADDNCSAYPADYLAMRLAITLLVWPEAMELLNWHRTKKNNERIQISESSEVRYRDELVNKITSPREIVAMKEEKQAQLVFCIDVRSEPFRNAIESTGHYETYGFAGFFGVPVTINDKINDECYDACPVLLKPAHQVELSPLESGRDFNKAIRYRNFRRALIRVYQSAKYAFVSPFVLAEMMGPFSGLWMTLRTLFPQIATKFSEKIKTMNMDKVDICAQLENISIEEQTQYAFSALRLMGLSHNFAPLVVLCGHGSSTQNNPFATALDCGACGGRHGGNSARVLTAILNNQSVRSSLSSKGIKIPQETLFVAAEHNTTTDEVELYLSEDNINSRKDSIARVKEDLERARQVNTSKRCKNLGGAVEKSSVMAAFRASDWAQVRPEWGLARNAGFIVAPRDLTKKIDLQGRAFLHSYDWQQDPDGESLKTILCAPMVVASWINQQYLFSTVNNVAFGAGSKITSNITGKMGIMQGNSSDLMTGLPLQSVYKEDGTAYHEPLRLLTLVYAPRQLLSKIIEREDILKKLFGNGWVNLVCIDPNESQAFVFNIKQSWEVVSNV